jgi:DNA-binding FrmR family transcriptional regulator
MIEEDRKQVRAVESALHRFAGLINSFNRSKNPSPQECKDIVNRSKSMRKALFKLEGTLLKYGETDDEEEAEEAKDFMRGEIMQRYFKPERPPTPYYPPASERDRGLRE